MARKATNQATTIGIDIDKNNFHLIGLNVRYGSKADIPRHGHLCPLLGAMQTSLT